MEPLSKGPVHTLTYSLPLAMWSMWNTLIQTMTCEGGHNPRVNIVCGKQSNWTLCSFLMYGVCTSACLSLLPLSICLSLFHTTFSNTQNALHLCVCSPSSHLLFHGNSLYPISSNFASILYLLQPSFPSFARSKSLVFLLHVATAVSSCLLFDSLH